MSTVKKIATIIVALTFLGMGAITVVALIEADDDTTSADNNTEKSDSDIFARVDATRAQSDDALDYGGHPDSVVIRQPIQGDPYKELDELIGLGAVKEEVHSLANFVKLQKQRKAKGLATPKMSYHLVFTGSPGTGKTTVARIVARIYKDLGILKSGHTVETDRSGLVAEYVGQTAAKTNAIVDSALNGVLFIDEAYALVPENSTSDYGQEAISTLLKRMEDDRDKLVVIIAGYTNEMQRFIDSNPGLQSRFNRYINFPDYTAAELVDIFHMYMRKNEYSITDDGDAYLRQRLEYAVAHKDRNFGNARYVRNVFEKTIQHQANRLAGKRNLDASELMQLEAADIETAFSSVK